MKTHVFRSWLMNLAALLVLLPSARVLAACGNTADDWDEVYRERLAWWSLQPVAKVEPPPMRQPQWIRNEVDQFIVASLEANGLKPVAEADRRTLARRLSFALTGLPPSVEMVERFAADSSPGAFESLVQLLLDSPHFGER